MHPSHAVAAVLHRNPYPYYASLLAGDPLVYDPALGLWIAARAATVAEVFDNPDCRVRPPSEPVPVALQGTPAGEVFGRLIRMNDGAAHQQGKGVLERALARVPAGQLEARTRHVAGLALPDALLGYDALNDWVFRTPVSIVADLLGFSTTAALALADLVRDFVACLSPSSTPEQLGKASAAATLLQAGLRSMLASELTEDSLLYRVRHEAQAANWCDDTALLANLVGLLSQTYEACAGLLGNSIVALASHPGLLQAVGARPDGWLQLVHETSRHDPSVQNTRRFVAKPTCIAGVELDAGAVILLVLAAANRDAGINTRPNEFLLDRPDRRVFSFSRGTHACPGQALATTITSVALMRLFDTHGGDLRTLAWAYQTSGNGRLPVFIAARTL